jgi:tetratricopeptide (TPR) repeat protein
MIYSSEPEMYNNAMNHLKIALKAYDSKKDNIGKGEIYNAMGVLYTNSQKLDSALIYYNKALTILENLGIKAASPAITLNIAEILAGQNKDEALTYYLHSKEISIDLKDSLNLCYVDLGIGRLLFNQNQYNKAEVYLLSSLAYSKKNMIWDLIKGSTTLLSEISTKQNKFKEALSYYEIGTAANDSLRKQNSIAEMEQLKFNFHVKNIESELIVKQKEIAILTIKEDLTNKKNSFLIGGILLIITFSIVSFFRYKKIGKLKKTAWKLEKNAIETTLESERRMKQQAEENLLYKNQQLANFAIHISEKNNFLDKIKKNVKIVKKKTTDGEIKILISEIILMINSNVEINKEQVNLQNQVEQINESFFFKLNKDFPKLSITEKKLISLLKINLSSKQISNLLGLSSKSVDTYRYNLRKLFKLGKNENLIDFINKI